jgi:N-acetylneuraminic acid mutarotase
LGLIVAANFSGCGSSSSRSSHAASARARREEPARRKTVVLEVARTFSLPAPRERTATTPFGSSLFVSGGLSSAGVSTASVFRITASGSATRSAPLPSPVHDAAAASVGGRLLVLGGGESEGSNRIVELLPGPPHLVGSLPQALSDLDAATIGDTAYIVGGWNGSVTNRDVYAVTSAGAVRSVGSLALGVRYPAAAALTGRVVVAGGETSAGTPTTTAVTFDPASGRATQLPPLPVAADHAAGAVLNGRFYLIGGLHEGVFSDQILSWAPGEARWRRAGHLPAAVADLAASPFAGGIVVVGGRDANGPVASAVLLRPAS